MKTTPSQASLLGLLNLCPMSGYDLKKLIAGSIGHFWSESYGQIYPALKRLTSKGLVARRVERTAGRPDRQVYSLTAAGRDALAAWLAEPPYFSPPRNELLLKLFFGHLAPPAEMRKHVEEFRDRVKGLNDKYAGYEKSLQLKYASHPGLPFWLTTLHYGQLQTGAQLAWAEETLKTLDSIAQLKTKRRSRLRAGGK